MPRGFGHYGERPRRSLELGAPEARARSNPYGETRADFIGGSSRRNASVALVFREVRE
jgi:hypothetical protein